MAKSNENKSKMWSINYCMGNMLLFASVPFPKQWAHEKITIAMSNDNEDDGEEDKGGDEKLAHEETIGSGINAKHYH